MVCILGGREAVVLICRVSLYNLGDSVGAHYSSSTADLTSWLLPCSQICQVCFYRLIEVKGEIWPTV